MAALKGNKSTMLLLVKLRASVNATTNCGGTPLIWASYAGHLETVATLVNMRVYLDACLTQDTETLVRCQENPTDAGMSAITWASQRSHNDVVSLLLHCGARVGDASGRKMADMPAGAASSEI